VHTKQASKQAKSKIKRVSRLCKSRDYLLISRLRKFPLCIDNTTTKMRCASKSKFQSYSISSQQPRLSLTQPILPSRKHPRCICPQALQISIRKKLSQVFQKHPRCLQISIKKKKKVSQVLQKHPRHFANLKIYIFSKCFEPTKQFPFTNPVPTTLRRTHTQELVTHLTFVKKERVHNSFNIFSLGGGGSSSVYLSIYLSI
jgi:hypothetical protein